jgi:hypothetical protein
MCTKCWDPSSVPPWSLGLPWILGVRKWPTWPTLRGVYLFLVLTILFTHTSCVRNPIVQYPCCMVIRWFGYLTRPFNYILVKVLHCSLIKWERHATASQDHLALVGELIWRQCSRPRLHRRLTLRSPSGTLGMGLATQVTLSLASEPEPPPLSGTLTGARLWSGMSVMGLTRLSTWWKGSDDSSDRWMTLHKCKRRCKHPSTHRPAWCTDLSLGEVSGAQVWVLACLISFSVFPVILSLAC